MSTLLYTGNMDVFDPTTFNFLPLRNFQFPGGVSVFEYKNHAAVEGESDFLRLNLYLSKDGDYVTVWFGLLEPLFTESKMESATVPDDFDFRDAYNEELFKGHIISNETARHILHALRIGTSHTYAAPHILTIDSKETLRCEVMR